MSKGLVKGWKETLFLYLQDNVDFGFKAVVSPIKNFQIFFFN